MLLERGELVGPEALDLVDPLAQLVERLPRRPGQKEERYRHLLGGDDALHAETRATDTDTYAAPAPSPTASPGLEARVAALEAEVAELREALDRLAPTEREL